LCIQVGLFAGRSLPLLEFRKKGLESDGILQRESFLIQISESIVKTSSAKPRSWEVALPEMWNSHGTPYSPFVLPAKTHEGIGIFDTFHEDLGSCISFQVMVFEVHS